MKRIDKIVLENRDQIMKNMKIIQNKANMSLNKSHYFEDGKLENTTPLQQDSYIKQRLMKKILSWGAWDKG